MALDKEHLESMRWLYDSEESYRKAVRALIAEEVKERRREMLKKKARHAKIKSSAKRFTSPLSNATHKLPSAVRAKLPAKVKVPSKAAVAGKIKGYAANKKALAIGGAGVLAMLVALVFGFSFISSRKQAGQGGGQVAGKTVEQAPFQPLIAPEAGDEGRENVKYDDQKKVLSYTTSMNGTSAIVSQQEFPQVFLTDRVKFDDFIGSIPNHKVVPLVLGTAYLSVDEKSQLVPYGVYVTEEFLVFVKTDEPLEQKSWEEFFKNLPLR